MNLPHTQRMAPDFFTKLKAASTGLSGGRLAKFCHMTERIEREYEAIEAAAREANHLWATWAREEAH